MVKLYFWSDNIKDKVVTNGKVFVHNESKWKDLPGSFTIPGLKYIVVFNFTFKN